MKLYEGRARLNESLAALIRSNNPPCPTW